MKSRSFAVRLAVATCALCTVVTAGARATTVNCGAGQTISAAIAKLKPATGYQTINVSGACTENVYVPPGLALYLAAAAGASLSPANSGPTIDVQGHLVVTGLAITASSFTAVFVHTSGYASVIAGTITGPGTGIQVSDNGGVVVQNETINVTGYSAINAYNNGTIEVDGLAPIGSATGTTLTGAGDGINCAQGNVTLNASGGPITITRNGGSGVDDQGCNFTDYVSNGQVISITGNSGTGFNAAQASSVTLGAMQITNNGQWGIYAQANAAVQLSGGMTITGNGSANNLPALQAAQNAVFVFRNYFGGANTVTAPNGNTSPLFGCYQGGKQYVDAIQGVITPAPTKANIGCLTVGGK